MKTSFDVLCCYCDEEFSLVQNDEYTDDLFDDSTGYIERVCLNCGRQLHIEINTTWTYAADEVESDELSGINS